MSIFANEGNINWGGNWQKVTKADALHASTNLNVDNGATQYSGYWTGAAASTNHGCLAFLATLTTPATSRIITCTLESSATIDFASPTAEQTATFTTTSATKLLTWIHFKFGATEAEDSATPLYYRYKFVTDNAADTGFRADAAAATKVAVVQILNETGTPTNADVTYIVGLGTQTSGNPDAATVTVNVNDTTNNYGNCEIGNGGVMSYRTDASTTTELGFAGIVNVRNGGALYIGSTGTKIPNSSKAYMKFNCGSSRQYYLQKSTGGIIQMQGTANAYYKTKLDGAISAGTIKQFAVNDSTGWLVGDRLLLCYAGASSASDVVTITGIFGTTIYIDTVGDGSGTGVALSAHGDDGIVAKLTHPVQFESKSSSYYTVVILNDSNYDADFDGVGFKYSGVGNIADWANWGCYFDDVSFESCSNTLLANYQSWYGSDTFTNIVNYGNGKFMTGWYDATYNFKKSKFVLNGAVIAGWVGGGNNSYYNYCRCPMTFINVDWAYMYASGGSNELFSGNINSIYFENCTFEALLALTSSRFIALGTTISSQIEGVFRNCVFGTHTNMPASFILYITEQRFLFMNCIVRGTPTIMDGPIAIGIKLTPLICFQNLGQVEGRHIGYAKYGTISDQVTNGQTAAYAKGGSGICVALNPSSTTAGQTLNWEFYIPATAATPATLKFYITKTTAGFDGSVKVTIFDSDDDMTKLLNRETISNASIPLNDGAGDDWTYQYSATPVTPTNTGFCRVLVEVLNGASTGDILVDDVSVV